jgi:ABC-type uncharacterized transport system involved in gliding motility auxiliary subunit
MKFHESHRSLLLGGGTALGAIVVLAIAIAVQYIVLQHPKRWDLTRTGTHTLAPQSKKILDELRENKIPVDILAFYETKDFGAKDAVRDLLEQYRDVYADLKYSFVDPDQDRALALANKIESYPTIIIKAGRKEQRISAADEETVTNALLRLVRSEEKKIYFLKGHGEISPATSAQESLSIAKEQIEKQNYKTDEIVLLQAPAVPEDAAILVIAGPRTDPMDGELEMIRNYLKRGGSLLVLLNPFQTPKLCAFLKDYGFATADDIVVDRMSRVLGGDYLMPVITTYVKFPITKNFTFASFFPEARSVRASHDAGPNVTVQELALTSPASWTISEEQLKSGNANLDEKTGTQGPIPVMGVSTYNTPNSADSTKPPEATNEPAEGEGSSTGKEPTGEPSSGQKSGAKKTKARIVVTGSSLFASNKFIKLQGNGDLLMNSVSWLAEDENLISIRPKSSRSQPLVLTARDSVLVLMIPVVIMPLAWIIAGLIVYIYRRRDVTA